jgi:hypothetical protein
VAHCAIGAMEYKMKAIILALAVLTLTGCDRISYELYSNETMGNCEKRVRADAAEESTLVRRCYARRMDQHKQYGIEYDENGKVRASNTSYELYSNETKDNCENFVRADAAEDTILVMRCYNRRMDRYESSGLEYDENGDLRAKKRRYQ